MNLRYQQLKEEINLNEFTVVDLSENQSELQKINQSETENSLARETQNPPDPVVLTQSKPTAKLVITAKISAGILLTASSATVFVKPAQEYAKTSSLGESSWPVIFASSTTDFCITNLYLAAISLPGFSAYIAKQSTLSAKILKGGGMILMAASQSLQPFVIGYGLKASYWIIAASTIGQLPANIYATLNLIQHNLPLTHRKLKKLFRSLAACTVDRYLLSPQELATRLWERQMWSVQAEFRKRINEGWLNILRKKNVNLLTVTDSVEAWQIIVKGLSHDELPDESYFSISLRLLVQAVGVTGAAFVLAGLLLNLQAVSVANLPVDNSWMEGLVRAFAAYTGLSATYIISTFMTSAFGAAYDAVKNILQGNPIDWLAFQMRPKTVIGGTLLGGVIGIFSYSTILTLFDTYYLGAGKNVLNPIVIASMLLYRVAGRSRSLDLAIMSYAESSQATPEEKNLVQLYKAKLEAEKLSDEYALKDFCQNMTNLSADVQAELLGSKVILFTNISANTPPPLTENIAVSHSVHGFWRRNQPSAKEQKEKLFDKKEEKKAFSFARNAFCNII